MAIFLKIIALALITIFAFILTKQTKTEFSLLIVLVAGILIITLTLNSVSSVIVSFKNIFTKTGVNNSLLIPLLKIIGIGYLAEFSANLCIDAGLSSIADKVLFSAKIIILVLSLPIITNVIDLVMGLL